MTLRLTRSSPFKVSVTFRADNPLNNSTVSQSQQETLNNRGLKNPEKSWKILNKKKIRKNFQESAMGATGIRTNLCLVSKNLWLRFNLSNSIYPTLHCLYTKAGNGYSKLIKLLITFGSLLQIDRAIEQHRRTTNNISLGMASRFNNSQLRSMAIQIRIL